jgi:hypothetical protein
MKKLYYSALILFLLSISLGGYSQISNFTAHFENNIVMLQWQTGNEANTDRYIVEHGLDSIHFAPLHEIVAIQDNDSVTNYDDADSYPEARTNYYRLKEVTKDDQAFYSPVIRVDMDRPVPVLMPTVVYMGSTVRLDPYYIDQPLTVDFFNTRGMKMASYMVNGSSFDINTTNWGKGFYFYRISDPNHPLISAGKIMVM